VKNVFYVIIDAFCYNNLERKIGDEYTTPFLRELANGNICAKKMYSQAPYTEASLVALLSGENTLDNGGYLFGNRSTQKTVFKSFKEKGYKVIGQYSPYVYSKAYLRDIDQYFYTRLVSIQVVFDYRLSYYKSRYEKSIITSNEIRVCTEILEEEFETWIGQAESLLQKDDTCILIQDWQSIDTIKKVLEGLKKEKELFDENPTTYLYNIFEEFDSHNLLYLNRMYNNKRVIENSVYLENKYQEQFEVLQKKYTGIIRKDSPDFKYLLNILKNNRSGFRDFKGLVHNYMRYYGNNFLGEYLKSINNNTQTEVCMKKQFKHAIKAVNSANAAGMPGMVYLHVQDFHLPTAIHSSDYEDINYIENEIEEALCLGNKIDRGYKGNIIADLSARYCDNKIRGFYNDLVNNFGNDFKLIITADHGYPSYFNPPRSVIYNQTFVEAFHIPFIMCDGENNYSIDSISSSMDHFSIINNSDNWKSKRKYVLSEYAGPGCPDISDKAIWYTYIDNEYRVSVELKLCENISYDKLKGVYNIIYDKDEKNNLVKKAPNIVEVKTIMDIIQKRHNELKHKFENEKFLKSFFVEK
jgi:hypothetical protein